VKTVVFNVEGMSCQHCVDAVQSAVGNLEGVDEVKVDLAAKTAQVSYDENKLEPDKIKDEIEDQGFDVV